MATRGGAFAVLGGSIFTAFGVVGLVSSIYLSGLIQLSTGDFIRLWSEAFLAITIGFLVILAGFAIASNGRLKRLAGGLLGVVASVAGMLNSLLLLTTIVGLSSGLNYNAQFDVSSEILLLGCFAVLFVGFPLGMFGSVEPVVEQEPELAESAQPSA